MGRRRAPAIAVGPNPPTHKHRRRVGAPPTRLHPRAIGYVLPSRKKGHAMYIGIGGLILLILIILLVF